MDTLLTLLPPSDQGDSDAPELHGTWKEDVGFWAGTVSLFFLAVTCSLALWAVLPGLLAPWESSLVQSGSMEPQISTGDIVVWRTEVPADVGKDAVVIYERADGETIVHRIVDRRKEDGTYVLQGDANLTPDSDHVSMDQLKGWSQLLIPFIGLPGIWWRDGNYLYLALLVVFIGTAVALARRVWDAGNESRRGEDDPYVAPLARDNVAQPLWLAGSGAPGGAGAVDDRSDENPGLLDPVLRAQLLVPSRVAR